MFSALFFLLLGVGMVVAGGGYIQKARAMVHFQSTSGTVVARDTAPVPSGNTTEGRFGDGGGYWPRATYRYVVNGQEYTGDRRAFAYRGFKRAVAERMVAAIPDQVQVWFDPKNPAEAYLERHSATFGWWMVASGAPVALGGLIALLT